MFFHTGSVGRAAAASVRPSLLPALLLRSGSAVCRRAHQGHRCLPFASGLLVGIVPVRTVYTDDRHQFVDRLRMHVVGGRGGKGLISFESIDNVKQRPIGGHGGRGGDVIIEACASVRDLNQQSRVVHGRDGTDAKGKGNNGRAGRVKIITVPVGTLVKQVTRSYVLEEEALDMGADSVASVGGVSLGPIRHSKSGAPFRERVEVIADLDRHGDRMLAARGGRPGFGNKGSQLKYNEQVGPHVHLPHITGGAGEARYLEMELKSIADVGLVGFPNAGKSSFLGSVSKVSTCTGSLSSLLPVATAACLSPCTPTLVLQLHTHRLWFALLFICFACRRALAWLTIPSPRCTPRSARCRRATATPSPSPTSQA